METFPNSDGFLRDVVEIISAQSDLKEMLQGVAQLVVKATGSDVCFAYLIDEARQKVVLSGATPPFDSLIGKIELLLGEGIAGWVAKNSTLALVPDKWSDERYRYIPALKGENFASLISVPLVSRHKKTIGVINLHSRKVDYYSNQHVKLLKDVANLLSSSVENAILYSRLAERESAMGEFAARLTQAQESERRRLARDIHDGITQCLLSLSYRLDAAQQAVGSKELSVVENELDVAKGLLKAALDEARSAVSGLRPGVLDDLGLVAALESLSRDIPEINIDISADSCRLASHIEMAIYRIAQEAIQNIVKHSNAKNVNLSFYCDTKEACLEISDDGKGFDPQKLSPEPLHGYGLQGMRERAELISGRLRVTSNRKGTTICLKVPISL